MQESSCTETTSSDEAELDIPRKRKRNPRKTKSNYNVNVDGAAYCAVGPNVNINVGKKEDQRKSFEASRVLEDFESFLQDVIAFRGPEKDRIEGFIIQELLPYIENHAIKCRSPRGDLLEVLAKLGSPTLKSPRIAKRALKLLDRFIHLDLENGVTNAYIVATEKSLRKPIVDGSFKEELTHDQRRRIDVYCNVLMALLIGRTHGHITYPYNDTDKEHIEICISQIEKILRRWPLPKKYRRRLSLEIILSLLQRILDKKKTLKRLKRLLDVCEKMLDGFEESDVDSMLQEIDRIDDGALDLYVIMKMLHAKVNDQPKAFGILKAIVTRHDLFSSSWSHKKERDHWPFALLACQILVDVIINHRFKATREDAARTLASFSKTKAYRKSVVINAITDKYCLKTAFAPDIESRKILLENRFAVDQDELPLELLKKRLCTYNQSEGLEINVDNTICESDNHVILRGLHSHKPVIVKAIPVSPVSSLFNAQDQETSSAEKRFQNGVKITQHLNNKSNEHVPVCYAADTTSLPYHIVSEHMRNGDLLSYLKDLRERSPPSYRDALKICFSNAKNMEFLHENKVVHTQLRAENVLVGETLEHTKITGFSRARHTSDSEFNDGFKGEILSPNDEAVRWTNPAGLSDAPVYSSKSDVWAYGVLMYEIITCGNVPYLSKDLKKVREDILAGRTLPKEIMMKDGYYHLMQRCFGKEEISFTEICNELRRLISECDDIDDRPMVVPRNNLPTINEEQSTEDVYDVPPQPSNKVDFRPRSNSDKVRFKILTATLEDDSKQHIGRVKSLKHRHLVKVFQNKKIKSQRKISYEHYTVPSLRQYIKEQRCTEDDLIRFAAQITSALNHLHSNNIVHCSVTLDNVVVVNNKHVKLSGLQFTRSLKPYSYMDENYSTSTINVGQIAEYLHRWNANEVIQEGVVSKGSDIYSLGILLWEMFHVLDPTGDALIPFPQYKDSEILTQLKSGTRPTQPSKCPDWMYIVMTQCWPLLTTERASSLLLLDCLTHRIPWESCLLQNWLTKHKVYENTPNLNVVRMNADEDISPSQDDVMASISEEFAAEHDYGYTQLPTSNFKRSLKSYVKRVRSVFGTTSSSSHEPQESSWSPNVLEVERPRSTSILPPLPPSRSSLLRLPLPPLPNSTYSSNKFYNNIEYNREDQMDESPYEIMDKEIYDDILSSQEEQSDQLKDENQLYATSTKIDENNDQDEELHSNSSSQVRLYDSPCTKDVGKNQDEEDNSENPDEASQLQRSHELISEAPVFQPPNYQDCDVTMAAAEESQRSSSERIQDKNDEDLYIDHDLARHLAIGESNKVEMYQSMVGDQDDTCCSYAPFYQTPRLAVQNPFEQYRVIVDPMGQDNYDDIVVQYYV